MENSPASQTAAPRRPLAQLGPWLVVLLVLVFVGFIRWRLLEMPLERDEGEYAYAGQLLLQGIPPYELAYNMKLPGTYFAYAAGMALFGQTSSGIHLLLLVANAVTIVFVFLLGRQLSGPIAGLVACASYGLMSVSTAVLGTAAHATQFVVLFAVPGTWLLWRAIQSGRRGICFGAGLLLGLALVMKQQGMFFGIFGLVVLIGHEMTDGRTGNARRRLVWYVCGLALPFLVVCAGLACAGAFHQFWFWTFDYAKVYATGTSLGEGFGYLSAYLHDQFQFFAGFWVLALAGLVVALRNPDGRRQIVFALGFLFMSCLATAPGLYFRQHYFVLILPALALIVGLAVDFLQSALPRRRKVLPLLLVLGVMGWDVYLQRWAFFELSPARLSQVIYGDNPLVESQLVARHIRENSPADARVAVIGSEPQIYFYARRHSVTGYIYTYALMENQPFAAAMQQQMIREIEAGKPDFLVLVVNRYSWLFKDSSHLEIFGWVKKFTDEHYELVGLVDHRPGKPGLEVWNEAAKSHQVKPAQYLALYRRKP